MSGKKVKGKVVSRSMAITLGVAIIALLDGSLGEIMRHTLMLGKKTIL